MEEEEIRKTTDASTYSDLNKVQVFQEARIFNESNTSPKKCRVILSKIAYLLNTGEVFANADATVVFFAISKLFQNKNPALRQMMYIVLKQMAQMSEDVIMVTSSIMKDTTTSSTTLYKPNAIRSLCRVIDAATVTAVERLIKTAIIDKVSAVSNAALVCSYHLMPVAKDIVRRWSNEVQEVASQFNSSSSFSRSGKSNLTQYLALGLLYQMRCHDRMAITKIIQQFIASKSSKHQYSNILIIRFCYNLAVEDATLRKPMLDILMSMLKSRHESVSLEASKFICLLPDLKEQDVANVINVLQGHLSSPRSIVRFAVLRNLNKLSSKWSHLIYVANEELESFISDPNRSIATLAITTLLKTGSESSIDHLMKQIEEFLEDLTDESKVIIVDAIRSLCLKFPKKQAAMISLLSNILHGEGGYEFKAAAVDAIIEMIRYIPEAKSEALSQLCEFIEDCDYTALSVTILHLLGSEGPKSDNPKKFLRYIYNRIMLENAPQRAAAVNALAQFAIHSDDISTINTVKQLITRCLSDADDEVRDRAAIQLHYIEASKNTDVKQSQDIFQPFIKNDVFLSLPNLEKALVVYINKKSHEKAFEVHDIPLTTFEQVITESFQARAKNLHAAVNSQQTNANENNDARSPTEKSDAPSLPQATTYKEELSSIEEIACLGNVLSSSKAPCLLTDLDAEFIVKVATHVFEKNLVLQFNIENTLKTHLLENISIDTQSLEIPDAQLIPTSVLSVTDIKPQESGKVYIIFEIRDIEQYTDLGFIISEFESVLRFTSKELDSDGTETDAGIDDEYQLEPFALSVGPFLIPELVSDFTSKWDSLDSEGECFGTYVIEGVSTLQEAVNKVIVNIGLFPIDGTQLALHDDAVHTLKLAGRTVKKIQALAIAKLAHSTKHGYTMKLMVRSENPEVANIIANNYY